MAESILALRPRIGGLRIVDRSAARWHARGTQDQVEVAVLRGSSGVGDVAPMRMVVVLCAGVGVENIVCRIVLELDEIPLAAQHLADDVQPPFCNAR